MSFRSSTAYIDGEIDHHTAPALRGQIDEVIRSTRPREVRLDFYNVTFMDSSGVGLVMGRYKSMKLIGGSVELVNMPDYIEKVMLLAGMDKLVCIAGNETNKEEKCNAEATDK